jgi:hypothetical protein
MCICVSVCCVFHVSMCIYGGCVCVCVQVIVAAVGWEEEMGNQQSLWYKHYQPVRWAVCS